MSRTKPLFDLQTLDTQRAQVAARMARIEVELAEDSAVLATRRAQEEAETAAEEAAKALRLSQGERESLKARIAQEEAKLYGGQVKAPKELQGLQLEVDSLKRRLAEWDDMALEAMLTKDAAEEHLRQTQAAAREAEEAAVTARRALTTERLQLLRAQDRLSAERDRSARGIPPSDLARYETLRERLGGRAVAPVTGGSCGLCGMQVARHILDRILDDTDLITCGHCQRMLYAGAHHP